VSVLSKLDFRSPENVMRATLAKSEQLQIYAAVV
jgi:hypothetical protein